MKDPSSYQLIESKIIDTILIEQQWKNDIKKGQADIEKYKLKYLEDSLQYLEDLHEYNDKKLSESEKRILDDDNGEIKMNQEFISDYNRMLKNPTPKDIKVEGHPKDIYSISLIYKYRAKNGFGALDIEEAQIKYVIETNQNSKNYGIGEFKID